MKRALLVLLIVACSRKEQPARPAPALVPAPKPAVTTSRPPDALPEPQLHPGTWSIPPRGVVLWLIGDDAKTEFGGNLTEWTNEYLPTAKATADRLEMQPTVIANAINQHAVVHFDGLSNMMETNVDISPKRMQDATIFAVFSSRTEAPAPVRNVYGDDARAAGLNSGGGANNYCITAGSRTVGDFKLAMNTTYLTGDQFTKNELSAWVDGRQTLDKAPIEPAEALPDVRIGAEWQGDIAEIIVYSRVLSDLERMQVEDYLGKKYGIALTR